MSETATRLEIELSTAAGYFIRSYLRECLHIEIGDHKVALSIECEEVGIDPSSGYIQVELKLSADVYLPAVIRPVEIDV